MSDSPASGPPGTTKETGINDGWADWAIAHPARFWQNSTALSTAERQQRHAVLLLPHPALATPLIDVYFLQFLDNI